MGIDTQKYIRKPLYVDAVRVTAKNFDEIAKWCQGEVRTEEIPGQGTTKKYIHVRVNHPKNPRQSKAFVGDWLLYTERGYKVYTNKAFRASFDKTDEGVSTPPTPIEEPVAQEENTKPSLDVVRENLGMTPQGEPHEVVEATPQSISQAVRENEQIQAAAEKAEEAVQELTDQTMAEREMTQTTPAPPAEVNGKRILTLKEQREMTHHEVQQMLRSGEAVLEQDLVA